MITTERYHDQRSILGTGKRLRNLLALKQITNMLSQALLGCIIFRFASGIFFYRGRWGSKDFIYVG